jgi:hypothetical protein
MLFALGIAVVDSMGVTDAGIFGDILCTRMRKRGVAALITDGVVRDVQQLRLFPHMSLSPLPTARILKINQKHRLKRYNRIPNSKSCG